MDEPKSIEVEVTQEMVQVATEILWKSGRLEYEAEGADQLVVEEMLNAALSIRRRQSRPCSFEDLESPDGFAEAGPTTFRHS
ncbi:MAG: hypothetical protein M3495_16330 [Pseudomonadota bacterium]|nr:hypothetical protein [Pseudomonadota bacterium]